MTALAFITLYALVCIAGSVLIGQWLYDDDLKNGSRR